MADVTLNSAVRSNLRTLQATTDLMNRTEERLSTGKKVNSALDNPGSFFTSQALDRRASDLTGLLDSVSSSVKTLQAADNGIKAISKVVEGLKATARSALQSPAAASAKASVDSANVTGLTSSNILGTSSTPLTVTGTVTGLSESTTLASLGYGNNALEFGIRIWDDGPSFEIGTGPSGTNTLGDLIDGINAAGIGITASLTGDGRFEVTADQPGESILIFGRSAPAQNLGVETDVHAPPASTLMDGKTLAVENRQGATRTVTLSSTAGANNVDTLDELNAWLEANDVALTASVATAGGSGRLRLEASNAGEAPADLGGTIAATGGAFASAQSFTTPALDPAAMARRVAFVQDYNDALKQISALSRDASFNGVNLLSGDDLDIAFNEDGSSSMRIAGLRFDAAGLGLAELADAAFNDTDSIKSVLKALDGVFGKLESQSSKFGSQLQIVNTRQSFAKDMIGTLEDGSAALTSADTNAEAANLATLQTRQQLIVSALSISTGQEQNILQLLR